MRLCVVIPNFGRGGAEKILAACLQKMPQFIHVDVVTLDYDIAYEITNPRVNHVRLAKKSLKWALLPIRKLIVLGKYDYVYSTLNHINLVLPVLLFGCKIQLIARESILPITYYKDIFGDLFSLPPIYLYAFLMRSYSYIVVQSEDMRYELKKMGLQRLEVINNGISFDDYFFREEVEFEFDFVYVARFHSQKNHFKLLDFWTYLKKNGVNLNLLLIGDGEFREECHDIIIEKGLNVTILSGINNVDVYLKKSKYYLNFTKYEGFSNALLEALKEGLPVFSLFFKGGREELLNSSNSHVSKFDSKSLDVNFGDLHDEMKNFFEIVFDREFISDEARRKFDDKIMMRNYYDFFRRLT